MRKIKAAGLVIDYTLYPRNNVDRQNIRGIMDAIYAGEKMPPVIIDKGSKRVVDGVHRTLATLQIDIEGKIEVIEKTFKSDKELFVEAARLNACHGAKLDSCDRTHCLLVAERLGIPLDAIAGALRMTTDKLGSLKVDRTANVEGSRLSIPLKRTMRHMAGKKLTQNQAAVNERSSGMNQSFYVNQVIDLIESNMLNKDDEYLMERLEILGKVLGDLMAKV